MRVIISGATGFIGKRFTRLLLDKGCFVTCIVRNKSKESDEGLDVVEAELSDYADLQFESKYDYFFHFAWDGTSGDSRNDYEKQINNIRYTCEAVKLAKRIGCSRFVYAGSIMEYECIDSYIKDSVPAASYFYHIAKLSADYMGQTLANSLGIDYLAMIISNIYGEGEESQRFINVVSKKMLRNEMIELTECSQLYDFIYMDDAVEAMWYATEKGKNNQRYYIGNSDQKILKEYVLKMKEIYNSESDLRFGALKSGSFFNYDIIDTKKLEELGFIPQVTFDEGINKMKEWFYDKGF